MAAPAIKSAIKVSGPVKIPGNREDAEHDHRQPL
jgi:hypothetical protein